MGEMACLNSLPSHLWNGAEEQSKAGFSPKLPMVFKSDFLVLVQLSFFFFRILQRLGQFRIGVFFILHIFSH
jgi:hypothetical protein